MKTTFRKIKSHSPCSDGWKKLIDYYKPDSLDEEITIEEIVKSNGIKDAVWGLRAIDDIKSVNLFIADAAESVLYIYEKQYPKDSRVRDCINARRLFANNKISQVAWAAARDAAWDAAWAAARDAAWAAARDAAWAARDVAGAAAMAAAGAARDVAGAAAMAAARDAAWENLANILKKYY